MCTCIFSVQIFNLLQNCLHPDFHYVHLSAKEAGKVNRISTNSWHFPPGNVDFTVIFAIFLGKVNQIPKNPGHFPPGILLITLFFICTFGESEPVCLKFAALSPELINTGTAVGIYGLTSGGLRRLKLKHCAEPKCSGELLQE